MTKTYGGGNQQEIRYEKSRSRAHIQKQKNQNQNFVRDDNHSSSLSTTRTCKRRSQSTTRHNTYTYSRVQKLIAHFVFSRT